jgi:hypothetical protein
MGVGLGDRWVTTRMDANEIEGSVERAGGGLLVLLAGHREKQAIEAIRCPPAGPR